MATNRFEMATSNEPLPSSSEMHMLLVKDGTRFRTASLDLVVTSRQLFFSSIISSVITSKDLLNLSTLEMRICNSDL